MPVYFVIDPDFVDDPNMHDVESISLFYTFFRAKDFDDLNAQAYDESQQQQQQTSPQQLAQPQAVEKKEEAQT
jgi:cytochrome c oxidase assembly protein subunit 11